MALVNSVISAWFHLIVQNNVKNVVMEIMLIVQLEHVLIHARTMLILPESIALMNVQKANKMSVVNANYAPRTHTNQAVNLHAQTVLPEW